MLNALHVGQTGLNVARTVVENTMNNIANENTPGYKKRVVAVSELAHVDSRIYGRGVTVDGSFRITDQYVFNNLLKEQGKESYLKEISSMLSDVESVFFESESSGLSSDLDRFFQAIEELRANPYNEIAKNNLINTSNVLVDDLKNIYSGIEDRELATKNEIYEDVNKINQILHDIGALNEQINKRLVEPNDLLDKRDQLEAELAKYIDIEVDRRDNYELKIAGMSAVRYSTNIHSLNVVEKYTPQQDFYNGASAITAGAGDTISYKLDTLGVEVSVTIGGSIDFNDGNGSVPITTSNYIRALVHTINSTEALQGHIRAYNGIDQEYEDVNILLNDASMDKYLMIKSVVDGEVGKFDGRVIVTNPAGDPTQFNKNELRSVKAANDIHLEIFDKELDIKSGSLKAMTENLTTNSPNNKFIQYKEMLDNFASTLVDITSQFVRYPDNTYEYGKKAIDLNNNTSQTIVNVGLFSGSNVKSLVFNRDAIVDLTQEKLDYLAKMQWKTDIRFDGKAQDGNANIGTSFSKFYQTLLVKVSGDKQGNDFLFKTQEAVSKSLQSSYDQLTKVDKDEEMINLIKYQAAYEANAKIITTVDEMIQTILGIKR
ncbi:flagellar hook-associated protein FlgK [Arcobacter sp. FWKO B]|uniref:flagellar hook-associated protein FlgK n=1 Tax=Arcobacter sp. FWKO B TaxID=2593672 RepID=UPI0018A50634|nr:flagellar basal body rod C-terminal domain-containing protein [Arcobacter sp. FWKO B]QOG12389.1 flagellar hook-associated protein FlgK [Arcobacter sp. FWKO B]